MQLMIDDHEEIMDYDEYYEFSVVGTEELYGIADTLRHKILKDGWYNFYLMVSKFENKNKLVCVVNDSDAEDDYEMYELFNDFQLTQYERFIEIAKNA